MKNQNTIKLAKPYFENLDALRFIAAFSVFVFHFFQEIKQFVPIREENLTYKFITIFTSKGTLGVNFFFVLSGFLITYLIINEYQTKGKFSLFNFLIRRTLRIWPLYLLIILIGFVIFPLIFTDYYTIHSPIYYLLFLANFDELKVGLNDPINFLTAPWSVAVEEQFYLFWGTILFVFSPIKKYRLQVLIAILLLISVGFSFQNSENSRWLYYHTLSVMSNILIGAWLAKAIINKSTFLNKLNQINRWKIIAIYIIGVLVIIAKNKLFIGYLAPLEQICLSFFFAFVIYDQIKLKHSWIKFGEYKWMTYLGQISYGLYLYHLVVFYVLTKLMTRFIYHFYTGGSGIYYVSIILFFALGITLTILISKWSYKYFEKPFLILKKKFN